MRNKRIKKSAANRELVIRCDYCYAAFVGHKAMKQFNRHHLRMHKGQLSLFTQLYVMRDQYRELDFDTMQIQAAG